MGVHAQLSASWLPYRINGILAGPENPPPTENELESIFVLLESTGRTLLVDDVASIAHARVQSGPDWPKCIVWRPERRVLQTFEPTFDVSLRNDSAGPSAEIRKNDRSSYLHTRLTQAIRRHLSRLYKIILKMT